MSQPSDEHSLKMLRFIERYQYLHNTSPSYRAIGAALGIQSTDHVSRDLHKLARDGFISIQPRRTGAITLLTPKMGDPFVEYLKEKERNQ